MCLPDFVEFKRIKKDNALIGYRNWRIKIKEPINLISSNQDYTWLSNKIVRHKVEKENSGIYAYNYYNNYNNYNYYNYYYNNYYNYNNYNYNNYNNYYNYYNYNNYYYNLAGIILQYGKVAIHKSGYRSEYAKVKTLFTIRESDARGPQEFLNWIKQFNSIIEKLAKKYKVDTIHWQDFKS